MPLPSEVARLARVVWDYHHLGHTLAPADILLGLGSHDTRVAERAAELFLAGYAPWLVFSGGLGRLTEGVWDRSEAEVFAGVAARLGVPRERILTETRSTNTGENIVRTDALLRERGIGAGRVILVQKPYMERRAWATAKRHWPHKELRVTSPQVSFEEYPNAEISAEELVHIMVGDLQRIPLYAARGYQVPQEIPAPVWDAFERLVALGYTNHLVPE